MAMQTEVQYITYVDGSAARQFQPKPIKKVAAPKPKARKAKCRVLRVDPVAVVGIVVAAVMFIAMVSSFAQYQQWQEKNEQMSSFILAQQQELADNTRKYKEGYDLEQVRQIAMALGMVPAQEAERITVDVQLPEPVENEQTFWDEVITFLAGLFA